MTHTNSVLITHEHGVNGEKLALLAVFAHPEDESFGPAGTLARYASEGIEVSLAMATRDSAEGARIQETARARPHVFLPYDRRSPRLLARYAPR